MQVPPLRNWQALTLGLGLFFMAILVPDKLAHGLEGFEKFREFKKIYEPSGLVQLADESFVVVEDEASSPLDLFDLDEQGDTRETYLARASLFNLTSKDRALNALEDLEGLTVNSDGWLYAVTSHSRNIDGKRRDGREQLARFRLRDGQISDFEVVRNLRKRITKRHDLLKDSAKWRDVKGDEGFNIEAMTFDASGQKLLIGFRGPLDGDDAVIVTLDNPERIFSAGEKPEISQQLIRLDLDGGGIRAMCYDPSLEAYLIIARKQDKRFKLWRWDGDPDSKPVRVKIVGSKNLRQAEGITPVRVDGKPVGLLIVSDEGDNRSGKPGRYLFVTYDQLNIR